jgi:hypothetical protein
MTNNPITTLTIDEIFAENQTSPENTPTELAATENPTSAPNEDVCCASPQTSIQPSSQDDSLPPGRYIADITDVDLSLHYAEGHEILRVSFELVGGQYAGQKHQKFFHLKTSKIRDYMEKEFSRLGIDIPKREDFLDKYPQLLHRRVVIDVQYPHGSMVVYIQGNYNGTPSKNFDPASIWQNKA